ncbi:MAG: PD40 domain-containing protein [Bacteroidales bacterium]|nr:PD40 domain-containing protein [Bacteroidales bacterium]
MKSFRFIIIFSLITICVSAQYSSRNNDAKLDADYYLMMQEYDRAIRLYQNILKSEPDNADIKYKIGICYLNTESEKKTAIQYLEEAVEKVSEKYNPGSFKEMNAPIDAYFFLGSAYRVDNQLDKAVKAYQSYKELLNPRDEYNNLLIDQYIRSCHNALGMQQNPVSLLATNVGGPVNNESSNANPVVSGDGQSLAYTSPGSRQGYDIFYTTLTNGVWGEPGNITSQLGGSSKMFNTSSLSYDGKTLYLVARDPFDSDIYYSTYNRNRWARAEKMDKPVNGKSNETHVSITADGQTLFFTSDRKGGEGDLDIYKSTLNKKGKWSKPVNLGPEINTLFNEDTPFISPDGKTLFFSSEGHEGMGGSDIFRIDLSDPAAKPVNLGYPINTTDNNYFYFPLEDGNSGYYAMRNEDSYGSYDIYLIDILPSPVSDIMLTQSDVIEEAETTTIQNAIPEEPELLVQQETDVLTEYLVTEEFIPEEPALSAQEETLPSKETAASELPDSHSETPAVETGYTFEPKAYTIQMMALKKPVDLTYFRDIPDVSVTYGEDQWYRYTWGITLNIGQAETLKNELSEKGYGDAFIIKKDVVPNYTVQVMAVPGPVVDMSNFKNLAAVTVTKGDDIFCRYSTGEYETLEEARAALEIIRQLGYSDAFVRKLKSPF